CGDLSPLSSVATCRDAAGDRSPATKAPTGRRTPKNVLSCAPAAKISQLVIAPGESFVLTTTNRFREPLCQSHVEITRGLIVIRVSATRWFLDDLIDDFFCI